MGLLVISLFLHFPSFYITLIISNAFAVWSKGPPTGSQYFYFWYLKLKVRINSLFFCKYLFKVCNNILANKFTFDRNMKNATYWRGFISFSGVELFQRFQFFNQSFVLILEKNHETNM